MLVLHTSPEDKKIYIYIYTDLVENLFPSCSHIGWEKRQYFAIPPLFALWNDVSGTSTNLPYWWCVTTRIWVVILIGRAAIETCFNQSEAVLISALIPQMTFHRETNSGIALILRLPSKAQTKKPRVHRKMFLKLCNTKKERHI